MKQRLIDANKLEPDTQWNDYYDDYVSYSQTQINNAPTVDAIPVEWFKQKMDRLLESGIYGAEVYQWVLNRWYEDKDNWYAEGKENDETKTN